MSIPGTRGPWSALEISSTAQVSGNRFRRQHGHAGFISRSFRRGYIPDGWLARAFCITRAHRARRFDINRFNAPAGCIGRKHSPALILNSLNLVVDLLLDRGNHLVEVLNFLEKIGDVQEGVAIEANLYEGRLHAGKHARNTSLVYATN